jgi:predicted unusual protein kinase regulating ubiquinone biosynthesis (AarF/ABC1/UbiB family)
MKISLKPHHLKRYKDIALLFAKYSSPDFAREFDLGDEFMAGESEAPNGTSALPPEELANDLERMGPTFVKLGQLLSSRADLLPERYLKALARLQDKVKPFSYAEVEEIVQTELGVRLSKAFSRFDAEHLAAASLGQVHRAALRDGRRVVVKIQRPNIRQQISGDFQVLEEIAEFMDVHTKVGRRYQFVKVLNEFKITLLHELDYQREATNLNTIADNLKQFSRIHVPRPVADYTTRSVLTMQFVEGTKITELSPLARLDIDGEGLAEELFKAYLKQVLVDGIFHADPHPGNIFLTDDGRVALLDLGMVGHIAPTMQEELIKLLLAISDGRSDEASDFVLRISDTREEFDESDFRRRTAQLIADQKDAPLGERDVGKALLEVGKIAAETGLYVPIELTMLGKTLLQLDQVGKTLSPNFNPNASVRRNVSEILSQRMWKQASPSKMLGTMLELKDFVGALPSRLSKVLDTLANPEMELKIRNSDTRQLMDGFQKVANRITTGLILAALIVGASLLMQVNTSFRILGYPGFAMLCFLLAGAGGAWLVFSILFKDHKDKKRTRR